MSFLRLGALWALPLILLPVLIHLIHRRRHPTLQWAAMMFLHRATQARRGPAKVRRWLILAARMTVIAGLVFALARPLSSGAFGVAASRVAHPATSIVLLDRSPSMRRRLSDGATRLDAALQTVVQTIKTLGGSQVVFIDSVNMAPVTVTDVDSLLASTATAPADNTSDLPEMFEQAISYVRDNDLNVADIWVCSDRQGVDWNTRSTRWAALDKGLGELDATLRFYAVDFEADGQANTSIQVSKQRIIPVGENATLRLGIQVQRDDGETVSVPVQILAEGITKAVNVDLVDGLGVVSNVSIPMTGDTISGQVTIPADVNVADDRFFFSASRGGQGKLAVLSAYQSDAVEVAVEVFGGTVQQPTSLAGTDGVVCVGPLDPEQQTAVLAFLKGGGNAIFFPSPPDAHAGNHSATPIDGVAWAEWSMDRRTQASMDGLNFFVDRYAPLSGDVVRVAEADNGELLIGNRRVGAGTAWFCGCDVVRSGGAFVSDGVVLYGLLSEVAGQFNAGENLVGELAGQNRFASGEVNMGELIPVLGGVRQEQGYHSGVYTAGDVGTTTRLVAVNPSVRESDPDSLSFDELKRLLPQAAWSKLDVTQSSGPSGRDLVREVWGSLWIILIAVMLIEAWLSLPRQVAKGIA